MSDEQQKWKNELADCDLQLNGDLHRTAEDGSAEWLAYREALLTMRDNVDYREEEFSSAINPITNWPERPE